MNELASTYKHYKMFRSCMAQECKDLETLLHDDNLHLWDEDAADEICYLVHRRKTLDVKVILAGHWLAKISRTNCYAWQVLKEWRSVEESVFGPEIGEESLELLAFRALKWQRVSSFIVAAQKAIDKGKPLDVVLKQLFLDIQTASWQEIAAEGALL